MRFSASVFLCLLGVAVQALPVTSPKPDVAQANNSHLVPAFELPAKRQAEDDTTESKHGNDIVTKSKSLGTTDDITGYSWRPASVGDSLHRRQSGSEKTTEVKDGSTVITVSKSQGTTDDKKGYSWTKADRRE